jgi:hypothetical protein
MNASQKLFTSINSGTNVLASTLLGWQSCNQRMRISQHVQHCEMEKITLRQWQWSHSANSSAGRAESALSCMPTQKSNAYSTFLKAG